MVACLGVLGSSIGPAGSEVLPQCGLVDYANIWLILAKSA